MDKNEIYSLEKLMPFCSVYTLNDEYDECRDGSCKKSAFSFGFDFSTVFKWLFGNRNELKSVKIFVVMWWKHSISLRQYEMKKNKQLMQLTGT